MTRDTQVTLNSRRTLVVNFLGGPGCGKSTQAAELYSRLKKVGYSAELVQEYAKDLTWGEDWMTLGNQAYVTGKQFRRQCRVDGQVDVIVTDSCLLLGCIYRGRGCGPHFDDYVLDLYQEFWNLNIFLCRNLEGQRFQQEGRRQNLEQSLEKDTAIRELLVRFDLPSHEVPIRTWDSAGDHCYELTTLALQPRPLDTDHMPVVKTTGTYSDQQVELLGKLEPHG